jgi:hypothetical protein
MTPRSAFARAAALAAAAAFAIAPPAAASPAQESVLMDDAKIVYASPEELQTTLREIKALGVDRIRVSILWKLVAPAADQKQRPSFGAAGPASPAGYPREHWDRYDRIVTTAREVGLEVLFSITAPAPLWATGSPQRRDIEETYEPSPEDFRDFVTAVGRRYSGEYRDETDPPQGGGGNILFPSPPPAAPAGPVLPRVSGWSIWNEPNHPGWLTPSWRADPRGGGRPMLIAAPHHYRKLVDAGWAGLEASGHGGDLVMLGETAPRGLNDRQPTRPIRPLEFIREMYCLNARMRPFTGSDAEVRGCPGSAAAFAQQHPGLFRAPAWAHHPYALEQEPSRSDRHRDNVVLADVGRLTRTLDRIFAIHGQSARLPIWLTEYGYQTDPPDPTIGVPWSRQAAYLNEADYIAYRNPRVASTAQFQLFDEGPLREYPASDPRYWGAFQAGLRTHSGTRKTSYGSYQRPIHAPARVRRGRSVGVWGQLRTAETGARLTARLQRRVGRHWRKVAERTTGNPRGYVAIRTRPRATSWYRLVWRDPASGRDVASRRVKVTVVRR